MSICTLVSLESRRVCRRLLVSIRTLGAPRSVVNSLVWGCCVVSLVRRWPTEGRDRMVLGGEL